MSGIWLISFVALWILVIALTVVVLGLVRQLGLLYVKLGPEQDLLTTREGLEIGSHAPDLRATDILRGKELTLADLQGRPSILVFVSPGCGPCQELMPGIAEFQSAWSKKGNLIVVSQTDEQASRRLANTYQLRIPVLPDATATISKKFLVRATPFAYRLDKEGIVRWRGIINDLEGLEALTRDDLPTEVMVNLPYPDKTSIRVS